MTPVSSVSSDPPARRSSPSVAPLCVALAALIFGTALRFQAARQRQGVDDFWQAADWEYYGIGAQLADASMFRPFPGWPQTAFRLPLYPSFAGLARRAAPGPASLRAAHAALDALAWAGAALLAWLLGGPWCGALALLLGAVCGPSLGQIPLTQIETLLGFLLATALAALAAWAREPASLRRSTLAGLAVGMTLSCRSTLLLFPPLAACVAALAPSGRGGPRIRLGAAALFLALSYLPLVPWIARNAVLFERFIPVESGAAGLNFWGASEGMIENPTVAGLAASGAHREFLSALQGLPDAERGPWLTRRALKNIRARPLRYAAGCLRRLPRLWAELWWLWIPALGLLAPVIRAPALPGQTASRPGPAPLPGRAPPAVGIDIAPIALLALLAACFNAHAFMGVTPRYARPAFYSLTALAALGVLAAARRFAPALLSLPESADSGNEPAPPARLFPAGAADLFALGGLALGLVCYAWGTAALLGEAWRQFREPSPVPAEYRLNPGRYLALKTTQAQGINDLLAGKLKPASDCFSLAIEEEPCFGEALLGRAQASLWRGDRNAASADYRRAALCLESNGKPSPSALDRLIQY